MAAKSSLTSGRRPSPRCRDAVRWLFILALGLATAAPATAGASRWYPAGYTLYPSNPNIAGKWDRAPRCRYGSSCVGLYLVTRHGCSDELYAEVNIVSPRGVVVGFTNDSVSALRPGQVAHLTFSTFGPPAGATPELTKIHCF